MVTAIEFQAGHPAGRGGGRTASPGCVPYVTPDPFRPCQSCWCNLNVRTVGPVMGGTYHCADGVLDAVLFKARFWQRLQGGALNERQIKVLNRLLDGLEGKLTTSKFTTSKWAAIAKCSSDTALRDIGDLVNKGVLHRADAGGRSTSYELKPL